MDYKISDICSNLSIGKSTVYNRIDILKKDIPKSNLRNNDYFYYNDKGKLFITDKGFDFIKNFNSPDFSNNFNNKENSSENISIIYQNQIIDMYKQRIEYLENENKRLLDIISVKEQKELAKDIKYIGNNETVSFWDKFFNKFKK